MSFLKAEWRKLAIANYEVAPEVLQKYVPAGTVLDLWKDRCYVSLIGFMFLDVKVLGIKIPFHVNFEEINLRFYVKRFENGEWKRGVVFIKEVVPKPAITFVANTLYNENYQTLPMKNEWKTENGRLSVDYQLKKADKWHFIRVQAAAEAQEMKEGSETEFITEHYWGYAAINAEKTNEYEVTHPRWQAYAIESYAIDFDFGVVYGEEFAFLNEKTPTSVMLAEGSKITIEGKRVIQG